MADYMALALGHPEYGYYRKQDPLGAGGDFTTAPEISQVFGELVGLWAAVVWQQAGSPEHLLLVECGPGRGTLMSDALRAARTLPGFLDAVDLHLVETSPALRTHQRKTLSACRPAWHDALDTVPEGPVILIANEFFDALPVRQFVRTDRGWAERRVGLGPGGLQLVAGPTAAVDPAPNTETTEIGAVFETSPVSQEIVAGIARRIAVHGGAALIVDYGHAVTACGDTLQAVRAHGFADPLDNPGTCDLTAHVDFGALARQARNCGTQVFGPATQRAFLTSLGILQRTQRLARAAAAAGTADSIISATNRLIDPAQMGTLFRAMAIAGPTAPPPPGFEV